MLADNLDLARGRNLGTFLTVGKLNEARDRDLPLPKMALLAFNLLQQNSKPQT